jgi:PD-(D/E)XK nuclease superfamily
VVRLVGCSNLAMVACADQRPEAASAKAKRYGLRSMSVDGANRRGRSDLLLDFTVPAAHNEHTTKCRSPQSLLANTFIARNHSPSRLPTRSWAEVRFGEEPGPRPADPALPWNPASGVHIGDIGLHARGSIDRLDLNASGDVRVSDYKTGREPPRADRIVLGGGPNCSARCTRSRGANFLGENAGLWPDCCRVASR